MTRTVVVGGGIIGTSVAAELAAAGREVTLFEKDALGAGTTSDSIAVFLFHQSHPHPTEHRLRERAWDHYRDHIEAGRFAFERIGTLHVASTPESAAEVRELGERHREFGVDVEYLEPADLAEFGIDPDAVAGAIHYPGDGYLDPGEMVQHYAGEAAAAGAGIHTGVAVTDVETDGGTVTAVETTEGTVEADAVVNAAGPWADRVDDMAGVSLPLRHTYGPILVLDAGREIRMPNTFFDSGYYIREEGDRQLFAGRFAVDYEDARGIDPDANHEVDAEFRLNVADLLDAVTPGLADAEVVGDWMGVRTVTPDGRPVVGQVGPGGYYVATGMSGYGIVRAPVVAESLAALIGSGAEDEFLSYMSPDRFEAGSDGS